MSTIVRLWQRRLESEEVEATLVDARRGSNNSRRRRTSGIANGSESTVHPCVRLGTGIRVGWRVV